MAKMIEFECPECDRTIKSELWQVGTLIACKSCGKSFKVPRPLENRDESDLKPEPSEPLTVVQYAAGGVAALMFVAMGSFYALAKSGTIADGVYAGCGIMVCGFLMVCSTMVFAFGVRRRG